MEKTTAGIWVPAEIARDTQLASGEKLLYGAVLGLSREKGYCYATNGYLGELLGCSSAWVRRMLYRLVKETYLRSELKRQSGKEPQQRRLYPLCESTQSPCADSHTPHVQIDTVPLCESTHQNNIIDNKKERIEENHPPAPRSSKRGQGGAAASDSDFDRFWAVYPKKVDKQTARKAFGEVTAPLETLLTALERQKCSPLWNRENGRYIPLPANWLKRERWEDDLGGETKYGPTLDHSKQTHFGLVL